jgi:hypothetical protein
MQFPLSTYYLPPVTYKYSHHFVVKDPPPFVEVDLPGCNVVWTYK